MGNITKNKGPWVRLENFKQQFAFRRKIHPEDKNRSRSAPVLHHRFGGIPKTRLFNLPAIQSGYALFPGGREMIKTTRLVPIFLALVVSLSACNLPSNMTPTSAADVVLTSAAQTVEANQTQAAILNPPTIPPTNTAGFATSTLTIATSSVPPTSPPPTQSCDLAQFVDDVTIPDGTTFKPNETFTKTWRLKNIGTCTWTASYAVVFSSGDSMSGPSTQTLTGNVNPGQTVDISIDLKAPAADGNYRGNWKLRNAAGVLFSQFYVDIKVKTPTPTSGPTTITLSATGGTEGGTVYEPAAGVEVVTGTILAGDTSSNFLARGYMSFDISSITGKTITAAALDLSSCSAMQDPFAGLAGIWVGEVQYALPLDQSDYNISGTGIQQLNSLPGNSTIDVKSYVQARATEGKSRFQIRLHPAGPSDADGQGDYMSCSSNGPKLTITYQP
jgi:hypothetical protein